MLVVSLLFVALGAEAVILRRQPRAARPGRALSRPSGPTSTTVVYTNTTSFNQTMSTSTTTSTTTTGLSVANRAADSISCTPTSLCFDGRSCGVRYGGCYDINYCDGNMTPFPIPTCDPAPKLTSTPVSAVPTLKAAALMAAMAAPVARSEWEDGGGKGTNTRG